MIILNPIFYAISEKTDSIEIGLVCYYIIFVNLKLFILHNINYVKTPTTTNLLLSQFHFLE